MRYVIFLSTGIFIILACAQKPKQELIYHRDGQVYEAGLAYFLGDVAIQGDTIAAIGNLDDATGKTESTLKGSVAPVL